MLISDLIPESHVWIGFCVDYLVMQEKSTFTKRCGIALIALEQSGLTPKVGERIIELKSHCSYTMQG